MDESKRIFSGGMKDFLERVCLAAGDKPGAWSVIWDHSHDGRIPLFGQLNPEIYDAVKDGIISIQLLALGAMTAAAIHLKPGHGVEIGESPVNLADYLSGEHRFWAVRMGTDVIYYVVTSPLLVERENRLLIVVQARNLLERLAAGERGSGCAAYLPEIPIVEFCASRFGLRWAQCRHEEYYYGNRRFRYAEVVAFPADPAFTVRIYIFDHPESLSWLRSNAREVPENNASAWGRTFYRCHDNLLLVVREDFGNRPGSGSPFTIEQYVADLCAMHKGAAFSVRDISVVTIHKMDPNFQWRSMLGIF